MESGVREAGRRAATALELGDGKVESSGAVQLAGKLQKLPLRTRRPTEFREIFCNTPPSWRKSAQIARRSPPAGFWNRYFRDLQFPGGKYEIFFDIGQVESFLRPPFGRASHSICRRVKTAVEKPRMVQERCFRPECEERGILAESGLQNATYCHDLETPGVRYRGALKTVEVPVEGLWMALNGPN